MTVGELKERLEMFSDERDISILIQDPTCYENMYQITGIRDTQHDYLFIQAEQ